jgi:uncharacterized protein YkwD
MKSIALLTVGVLAMVVALGFGGRAEGEEKKGAVTLSKDEAELLELVNTERAKAQLPSLSPNSVLFDVARGHSANMAKQKKVDHVLDGKSVGDRLKAAGYIYKTCGENVHSLPEPSSKAAFAAWMKAGTSRAPILHDQLEQIGIGVVRDGARGKVYYTLVFGTPKP